MLDTQCGLEVACREKWWKLVYALVNAGANVDTRFQGGVFIQLWVVKSTISLQTICSVENDEVGVALHAACHYRANEMVYFLLDKGANPNIVG